jgi:hypothetical protein
MRFPLDILQKQHELLPEDVKEAISSTEVTEKLSEIAKKNNLLIDESGILEEETSYVMLGLTHPNDFAKKIRERLGVDQETANNLVNEVNSGVFLPIRESLMKLHEKEEVSIETTKSNNLTPSKEQVLNEIENPVVNKQTQTVQKPSTELMIGKLTGIVQIPGGRSSIPVKKPFTAPLQTNKPVEQNKNPDRPRTPDPYREQIS